MKNRRIEVSLSRTINTGNFESIKVNYGISGEIKDSADIHTESDELYDIVEGILVNCCDKATKED